MSGRDIQVNPGTLPPGNEHWSSAEWMAYFERQSAEREREIRARNEQIRVLREKNDDLVKVVREVRASEIYISVDTGVLCVKTGGRTRPISLYWSEAMGVFSEESAAAVRGFLKDHKHEMAHKGVHWDPSVIQPGTPSNKETKAKAALALAKKRQAGINQVVAGVPDSQ
jgi:hypothetical protein